MPAKSEKQQQFFGIVRAIQTGKMKPSKASPEARKAAKEMSKKDVEKYASTKHKGLPVRKEEIVKNLRESQEYVEFFKSAMDKFGITSINQLSDEKKKEFFDYVDNNWKAKTESVLESQLNETYIGVSKPKKVGEMATKSGLLYEIHSFMLGMYEIFFATLKGNIANTGAQPVFWKSEADARHTIGKLWR